jgi:hypothetical protein
MVPEVSGWRLKDPAQLHKGQVAPQIIWRVEVHLRGDGAISLHRTVISWSPCVPVRRGAKRSHRIG